MIKELLKSYFEDSVVENITSKQLVLTDRCKFETVTNVQRFCNNLCDRLIILENHSFITHQQVKCCTGLKKDLRE